MPLGLANNSSLLNDELSFLLPHIRIQYSTSDCSSSPKIGNCHCWHHHFSLRIHFNSKPLPSLPSPSFNSSTITIMARSLRSKRKQANKRKLRADVFAPVEAARTARLAAAQKKIADEPKHADASKKADEPTKDNEPKNAGETKSVEEAMPASREASPMEEDTIQNGSQHRHQDCLEASPNRTLTMHRQFHHAARYLCPAPTATRW